MPKGDVAARFVRAAVKSVESRGVDIRRTVTEAGLSPALLANHTSELGPAQATALLRMLCRVTDDELMGLGPAPVARGTFRMISLGVIHSSDLDVALTRLMEFISITTGFRGSRLVEREGRARLELGGEPPTVGEPFATEILLAFVHRFAAWLIGQRITLTAVELPFPPPDYADEHEVVFGVMPRFDASRPAIEFDAWHLAAPIVRDEPAVLDFVRRSPADIVVRRGYATTTTDKVRAILERGVPGRTSAGEVGARLAISVPHLRRLLRGEGTSFHGLRDEVLRNEAIESLRHGGESIDGLSQRLGFSEPSAFRRAFARWTGLPPGVYRDRQRQGAVS